MLLSEIHDNVVPLFAKTKDTSNNSNDSTLAQIIDFTDKYHKKQDKIIHNKELSKDYTGEGDQEIAQLAAFNGLKDLQREFDNKIHSLASPTILSRFSKGTNLLQALFLSSKLGDKSENLPNYIKFANKTLIDNYDLIKDTIQWFHKAIYDLKMKIIKKYNPPKISDINSFLEGGLKFYIRELDDLTYFKSYGMSRVDNLRGQIKDRL